MPRLISINSLGCFLLPNSLTLCLPMVQKYLPFLRKHEGLRDDNKHKLFCFTRFRKIKNHLRKDLVIKDILWFGWWLPFLVWEQMLSIESDCTWRGKIHSVCQVNTKDVTYLSINYISAQERYFLPFKTAGQV